MKELRPRADGKRHDCCDFCPNAEGCNMIEQRCFPDPSAYPLCEIGGICHQCFNFDKKASATPYYERLIVKKVKA